MSAVAERPPEAYWDERAERYGRGGSGLAAVCSYGMPEFHNRAIDLTQRVALRPELGSVRGLSVLDAGCGVGRWSRRFRAAGAAWVLGVVHSAVMVDEARARSAELEGVDFRRSALDELDLPERFDLVLAVTVLQHVLDEDRFRRSVARLAAHVAPGGRLVFLEAAPRRANARCDSAVFRARTESDYLAAVAAAGLRLREVRGVDPAPFRTALLPAYRRLPRPVAVPLLAAATLAGLGVDVPFGRALPGRSWHKVFVASKGGAS
jgi:2-polyprenyl-3-methyl-5-hydroxy-6-metoxy-1,4-benzoquinol methylase